MRPRIETLLALALLAIVPFVFYWSMVVRDLEPVAADTQAHKPIGAWAREFHESEGRPPEWIPSIFSGMPSYGSFLYIPRPEANLLGQLLQTLEGSRGARYALLFAVAGLAAFGFFRRQRFSRVASTTAALGYSLTPYFTGLVAAGHSTKLEALALAPLVLLAFDLLLDRPGPWTTAFLGYAVALLAWANHPQILYYLAIVLVLYGLGRWGLEARRDWISAHGLRIIGFGALAALVAGTLVATPYLVIHEYTPHSIRGAASALAANPGETGVGWEYATAWSYPPQELIAFLFPAWFGLAGSTYWGHLPFTQSTHYVGILFLLLAGIGVWKGAAPRKWIWGGLSVLLLLIGFGSYLPLVYRPLYELLPLFDRFRVPSMIYALLPLTLGTLVCSGLDETRRFLSAAAATPKSGRSGRRGPRVGSALLPGGGSSPPLRVGLFSLVAVLLAWALFAALAQATQGGPDGFLRPQEVAGRGAEMLRLVQAERRDLLFGSLTHGFLLLAMTAAVVAVAGVAALRRGLTDAQRGTWAAALLGLLVVADVWRVDRQFYTPEPTESAQELLPHPGAAAFLAAQPGPFRILPLPPHLASNSFVTAGLESIGGYQPAKLRIYQDLMDAGILSAPGVLRMLDVQYVLSSEPVEVGSPPLYDEDGYVYRLPETAGRVWSVPRLEVVPSTREMLGRLADRAFDPTAVALIYEEATTPARRQYQRASVAVSSIGAHELRARVEAIDGPAFVVFSEIYYAPAWQASIDGEPTHIHQVDHVLRGVEVPPGTHEVLLRYHSPAQHRAVVVSRAGVGLFIALLVWGGFLHLRQRRSRSSRIQ